MQDSKQSSPAALKDMFLQVYNGRVKRPGSAELLQWLESTDFFTAPASTRYHLAEPGGLCHHSLNVFWRLTDFISAESMEYSDESVAIVSLLHDVCKANMYTVVWKNQKIYLDPDSPKKIAPAKVKSDSAGKFYWDSVPAFEVDEQFLYGHGEKSVYLISKYMDLTDAEAQAIRAHMGPYQDGEKNLCSNIFSQNPLAFFLHMADGAATFIDET